jgi:hypothetical protein
MLNKVLRWLREVSKLSVSNTILVTWRSHYIVVSLPEKLRENGTTRMTEMKPFTFYTPSRCSYRKES